MTEQLERQIIGLVAADRIEIPISSISGKLKRRKPKLAGEIDLSEHDGEYTGERAYARVEEEDKSKARGMRDGIEIFSGRFPKYGKILNGIIEERRTIRETHLYFGMQPERRLTSADYMSVMTDLGFSEGAAESLYGELMSVSRNMSRKRDEERSILIG